MTTGFVYSLWDQLNLLYWCASELRFEGLRHSRSNLIIIITTCCYLLTVYYKKNRLASICRYLPPGVCDRSVSGEQTSLPLWRSDRQVQWVHLWRVQWQREPLPEARVVWVRLSTIRLHHHCRTSHHNRTRFVCFLILFIKVLCKFFFLHFSRI